MVLLYTDVNPITVSNLTSAEAVGRWDGRTVRRSGNPLIYDRHVHVPTNETINS
jgi:hypothetical protein